MSEGADYGVLILGVYLLEMILVEKILMMIRSDFSQF